MANVFGKALLARLTVNFYLLCLFVILVVSNFVFEVILILIKPVPGYCLHLLSLEVLLCHSYLLFERVFT